jgi:hypothetical protein
MAWLAARASSLKRGMVLRMSPALNDVVMLTTCCTEVNRPTLS